MIRLAFVFTLVSASVPLAADLGDVEESLAIAGGLSGLVGPVEALSEFGGSVADLGDLDGDGIHEVAIGAPRDDVGAINAGAVWVLFRDAEGAIRDEQKISAETGGFGGNLQTSDRFGSSVTGLGDVDGDGVPDLAIGVEPLGPVPGVVWILFLNADGTVRSELSVGNGSGGFSGVLLPTDRFGSSLAGLGDLDGDGAPELAVGAPGDSDLAPDTGALWILSLGAQGVVRQTKLSATSGGLGSLVLDPGDSFGESACALPDFDGDGTVDLAVGSSFGEGAVWILQLLPDGTARTGTKLGPETDDRLDDLLRPEDEFGTSVCALGDLDGNGVPDLAVGLPGFGPVQDRTGALLQLFLESDGSLLDFAVLDDAQPLLDPFLNPSGPLGCAVALVDDPVWPALFAGLPEADFGNQAGGVLSLRMGSVDPRADFAVDVALGAAPLTVSFQDLSIGSGITAWSWDFGDGSTSTLASPVHAFRSPGTFDVSLRVTGGGFGSRETRGDAVVVVSAASVSERNGARTNPDVLRSLVPPVLGTTWQADVDGSAAGWSGLAVLVGYAAPLAGVATGLGEVLVDVTQERFVVELELFSGGNASFGVSIPDDIALAGLEISCQALVSGPGVLTNALDVVLGL